MNRAEYKERLSRISNCINEGRIEDAIDLLDSINWRKLHNVNILLDGAGLYERAGKLYDAKELLEIAHERSPVGRMIIYRLAIVTAKLSEIEEARSYHQKFIELAPNDNLRFIIKYHISKAQGLDDRTLIPILEELKANEFMEEWAFELACLYRTTGQADKCVAILDEIILWFGEGPYVEKAIEMKQMYRPLSPEQADRYKGLSSGDSAVEIRPGDNITDNEFLGRTIRIPEIEVSNDKFNTVNLQAEIRKNIEEIMKASEMGEVSENMDAIKDLVGDIPFLAIDETETPEERKFDTDRLGESLKSKFKEYLSEEFDGQISLNLPEGSGEDDQIDGQMTIDDVMERWERTKRAAQAALSDAKQQELLEYKKKAIARASDVLERLKESEKGAVVSDEEVIEPLEEVSSVEVVDEENTAVNEIGTAELPEIGLPDPDPEEQKEESEEEPKESKTFVIPQLGKEGEAGAGFAIPVISAAEANIVGQQEQDEESIVEADKALKDINSMLQQEIDKLMKEESEPSVSDPDTEDELEEELKIQLEEDDITTSLSGRQKELLSYFAGIPGLEKPLISVINTTRAMMIQNGRHDTGHIIIHGRQGSGKTQLATNIIRVIQEETGRPAGNIGRIGGDRLNEKDIRVLFDRIRGGALIIEDAGEINRDTIVSLTIMMENDESGILVILEDTRSRMEALINSDPRFSKKFTERISIPVMTIDELVAFGKIYAAEEGYAVDEMAILALYDRINLAGRPDHPACVKDVKNIMDSAINRSRNAKRGLKHFFAGRGEEADLVMLQERDFREE